MKRTITVIGLGFVGLTTALAFAEKENDVYGFDIDMNRVNVLSSGRLPFIEPGLDKALKKHLNFNFKLAENVSDAISKSEFIFLCVGTPAGPDGEADLKYIYSALESIESVLKDGMYREVIIKSTVPPSTTSERVIPYIQNMGLEIGIHLSISNNPEFLREGKCWEDMIHADRIVCGVENEKSEINLKELYQKFDAPFIPVSLNTGEYIKYLSNTLLATMISYANEMSKIADVIGGIEVKKAFEVLHMDRRWKDASMSSYVYPGVGYGGYCLPKDTQAMVSKSLTNNYEPKILQHVVEVNNSMPSFMVNKIIKNLDHSKTIGILGLSFKPGSDDVRDSSSAKIIELLLNKGYKNLIAFDPVANEVFEKTYSFSIQYMESVEELIRSSDRLVLVTAWPEFKSINSSKEIIDCRYFL